jgi:hypothetical protein
MVKQRPAPDPRLTSYQLMAAIAGSYHETVSSTASDPHPSPQFCCAIG